MWLTNFRSAYLAACLDLLWRQWSAFGLLGQQEWTEASVLDPEALILTTLHFGRFDPRLFDGCVDWWLANWKWISSTRLRSLRKDLQPAEKRILSAIADVLLIERRSKKWTKLAGAGLGGEPVDAYPLLLLPDGEPLPMVGPPDQTFLRHGFLRPKLERRKVAQKVPMDTAAVARMKLRAFFGVTSRVEISLFLLTHESAYPRQVARHSYYSQPSISSAMAQMAASGVLNRQRFGREVEYRLDRQTWNRFLRVPREMDWLNWVLVFRALRGIWDCVQGLQGKKISALLLGSELKRCAQRINTGLHSSAVKFTFAEPRPPELPMYPVGFARDVEQLFRTLGGRFDLGSASSHAQKG